MSFGKSSESSLAKNGSGSKKRSSVKFCKEAHFEYKILFLQTKKSLIWTGPVVLGIINIICQTKNTFYPTKSMLVVVSWFCSTEKWCLHSSQVELTLQTYRVYLKNTQKYYGFIYCRHKLALSTRKYSLSSISFHRKLVTRDSYFKFSTSKPKLNPVKNFWAYLMQMVDNLRLTDLHQSVLTASNQTPQKIF